jgi:hypothetical protein
LLNAVDSESVGEFRGIERTAFMNRLVIDTGMPIVGVYCVETGEYVAYRGSRIAEAIARVKDADEVVTYNGTFRDLEDLGRFAGIKGDLPLNGKHIDMQRMIWDPIVGSSLIRTYEMHFDSCPDFPFANGDSESSDDYEGSNQRDVYMTLKLWERWKEGTIDIMGFGYEHH